MTTTGRPYTKYYTILSPSGWQDFFCLYLWIMRISIILLTMVYSLCLQAQHRTGFLNIGPEYNYYPAGHMLMIQSEYALFKSDTSRPHHSLHFKLGVDLALRTGMSPMNDEEYGWGPGISAGYRYYFNTKGGMGYDGFFVGAHLDLWQLTIQWKDSSHEPQSGETSTFVVQPTIDLGYKKQFGTWDLLLGFNNGIEINAITNGKGVGQGWITSAQLVIARRLY